MSLIINDFEIVVESQAKKEEVKAEPVELQPSSLLTPQDIRTIIRYQAERMSRIRAH